MNKNQEHLNLLIKANLTQVILKFLKTHNYESFTVVKKFLLSLSENNLDLVSELSDKITSIDTSLDLKETIDLIIKDYFPE